MVKIHIHVLEINVILCFTIIVLMIKNVVFGNEKCSLDINQCVPGRTHCGYDCANALAYHKNISEMINTCFWLSSLPLRPEFFY